MPHIGKENNNNKKERSGTDMFFNCVLLFPPFEYTLDVINILQVFTRTHANVMHVKNGFIFSVEL